MRVCRNRKKKKKNAETLKQFCPAKLKEILTAHPLEEINKSLWIDSIV